MFDDHFVNQEQEHYDFVYPTQWEIHKEMARHIGEANQDKQWVLTDFDVWEKNPFYIGPDQPHPEDDYAYEQGDLAEYVPEVREIVEDGGDDSEIPF